LDFSLKQNSLVDDEGLFFLKMFEGVTKVDVSNLGNIRFSAKFVEIIFVASKVEVELGEFVQNILKISLVKKFLLFIFQMYRIYS
jgi:hypothetical protein